MKVLAKASVPACLKKHVVKKIQELFKEWTQLKRNKAKHSEELQLKKKWKDGLEDLLNIAHANALGMTTI